MDSLQQRIAEAVSKAQQEFWKTIAAAFPEAESGDFSPEDSIAFDGACMTAVDTWVHDNIPAPEDDDPEIADAKAGHP